MNFLFVLNDAPYGTESSYNGLRLVRELRRNKAGNFAPLSFVPVVRGGLKTYTMRGAVLVAPLFNDIGTEERT